MIKSTKLQYIDLKEGRMSTTNFMRNLRRDMPHLVTNVTSFKDAVRILNNKGILNENHDLARNIWSNMDFDQRVDLLLKHVKDPDDAENWADRKWDDLPDFLDANLSYELENIETQGQMKQDDIDFEKEGGQLPDWVNDESGPEREDDFWDGDDENLIDRGIGDDFNDGEFWENKEPDNINEAKITSAQAHPQELAMGRKVEMEHTDNVEKAEKIALDHLSEDPFYYTKLHIAGLADELNRPKSKTSTKKRTDIPTEVCKDNFTDKGNQMTVVKDVEKVKADANKAKKETNKGVGKITLMSLIAVKPRGVNKMAATGEKMKKIIVKENIDQKKFKELVQKSSKREIEGLVKDYTSNPSKYDISKEDMKTIILSLNRKNKLKEFKEGWLVTTAAQLGVRSDDGNEYIVIHTSETDNRSNRISQIYKDKKLAQKRADKLNGIGAGGRINIKEDNIQNRADEINDFAKLVKSKDINAIIEQYESIIQYPSEWNITATEAMKILQKYFTDEDWDQFEELTSTDNTDPFANSDIDDNDFKKKWGGDGSMFEASLNMLPDEQPNDVVTRVQEFIDSNPVLRQLSDNITLQNSGKDACVLKFDYWENLPQEAVEKLSLQFNVEREVDDGDDDKLPTIAYILTPKSSVDKGMGLNKLDELIKKELKEYFDGRDNLTDGDDEDVNSDGNIMENNRPALSIGNFGSKEETELNSLIKNYGGAYFGGNDSGTKIDRYYSFPDINAVESFKEDALVKFPRLRIEDYGNGNNI